MSTRLPRGPHPRRRTMSTDEIEWVEDLWAQSDFVDTANVSDRRTLAEVLGHSVPETLAMLRSED